MKVLIEQYIIINYTTGFNSDLIDKTTREFPPHPNIDCDEFIDELKYRYTDLIIYKDDAWNDKIYSNKYGYLLENESNIIKIEIEFYISQI